MDNKHSIDIFYHVLLHFAMRFQRRRLLEIGKELQVVAMFVNGSEQMCNLHRGHSIDDSYQVSVVAMFVNRSGQNEQTS
jgi:hypothetical protein